MRRALRTGNGNDCVNLVPRTFVTYCAGLTKRAIVGNSVFGSIFSDFLDFPGSLASRRLPEGDEGSRYESVIIWKSPSFFANWFFYREQARSLDMQY